MKKIIIIFISLLSSFQIIYSADQLTLERNRVLQKMGDALFDDQCVLWFTDALTGRGLSQAKVTIDGIGNFTTDRSGLVFFDEPEDGEYFVLVEKEGYYDGEFYIEILNGTIVQTEKQYPIPPYNNLEDIRIVLTWDQYPYDLDSHFVKSGDYHISFRNMRTASDGSAMLDIDSMNGYGPETITIKRVNNYGAYSFYVHNFSESNNPNSYNLSRSNAVVRVYWKGRLLYTFYVPRNRKGTIWNVFEIRNGNILEINQIH